MKFRPLKIAQIPLLTFVLVLGAVGSVWAADACAPVGWCTQSGGTTGGGNTAPVTVTTLANLQTAAGSGAAMVIYVQGTMGAGVGTRVVVASNKTIFGLPGATLVGGFDIKNANNVILRNMKVQGPGAIDVDGVDCVTVQNSTHVWLDHLEVWDGQDGNMDIVNGSNYICVSWVKFRYTSASVEHQFCNLVGNSDSATSDRGLLKVTWLKNWWDAGCRERMPRLRFGQNHVVNNLFACAGNSQCVRAGLEADLLVESNVFNGVNLPIDLYNNDFTAVTSRNNSCVGCSGNMAGPGGAFTPPYAMTIEPVGGIEAEIRSKAGASLTSPNCGGAQASTSTPTRTSTRTNTPVPPTPTRTSTLTTTRTFTSTASRTATPSATNTAVPPTNTPTRTSTLTATRSNTPMPPTFTSTSTPTRTNTSVPATSTSTPSRTATASLTTTSSATSTRTGTSTNTPMANTSTLTASPSSTATRTPTATPSRTLTATASATSTRTASPTSTDTLVLTATSSNTPQAFTPTPTASLTSSLTSTASATSTPSSTNTLVPPTNTPTVTLTFTGTQPPTASSTQTPTTTPSRTPTASATSTASQTQTSTNTLVSTNTPTSTLVNTSTASPTPSRTMTSSITPSRTATPSATNTLVSTATPTATATQTSSFTPTATSSATVTPTPSPSLTSTPQAGATPILSSNPADGSPIQVLPQAYSGPSFVTVQIFTERFVPIQTKSYGTMSLGWVTLELTDDAGQPLSGGLYYVRVTTKNGMATAKLLIVR